MFSSLSKFFALFAISFHFRFIASSTSLQISSPFEAGIKQRKVLGKFAIRNLSLISFSFSIRLRFIPSLSSLNLEFSTLNSVRSTVGFPLSWG